MDADAASGKLIKGVHLPRFYLLFSAAGLSLIALSYGLAPAAVLPQVLDINVVGTDQIHIFRAIMGLYLGMIVL
jgi:hypothetical protein